MLTRVLEFHASTNPSVRTNPTTTARKRDHTAHGNQRCGIETGEFRQDAMEGVVQGCWRSAAGRRRGSGLGHSLRNVEIVILSLIQFVHKYLKGAWGVFEIVLQTSRNSFEIRNVLNLISSRNSIENV